MRRVRHVPIAIAPLTGFGAGVNNTNGQKTTASAEASDTRRGSRSSNANKAAVQRNPAVPRASRNPALQATAETMNSATPLAIGTREPRAAAIATNAIQLRAPGRLE